MPLHVLPVFELRLDIVVRRPAPHPVVNRVLDRPIFFDLKLWNADGRIYSLQQREQIVMPLIIQFSVVRKLVQRADHCLGV